MIRFKHSVRVRVYSGAINYILGRLYHIDYTRPWLNKPKAIWVTSITDSHTPPSRHCTYEAVDIRSHNFPSRKAKWEFRKEFESLLNRDHLNKYRVLFEREGKPDEHFHVQVKKGTVYRGY